MKFFFSQLMLCIFGIMFMFQLQAQKQYPYTINYKKPHYEIFDTNLVVSKNGFGSSISLGYGLNFNQIADYFSNPFLLNVSMDFLINKFFIQVEGTFGLSKTKKEMVFEEGKTWAKDKAVLSGHYTLNFGASVLDNRFLLLLPNAGIGIKTMTSNLIFGKDISSNEPLLPYYKFGVFFNFKPLIISNHIRINNKDIKYSCFRLGINFEGVIGKPSYSEYYNGNMLFFTLGIGKFSRSYSSKYNSNKFIY
jgi:hypothetical protein